MLVIKAIVSFLQSNTYSPKTSYNMLCCNDTPNLFSCCNRSNVLKISDEVLQSYYI